MPFNNLFNTNITLAYLSYLFKQVDYQDYRLIREKWQVDERTVALCYLSETYIANHITYLDKQFLLMAILDVIEILIDDCDELTKIIKHPEGKKDFYYPLSIAALITRAINKNLQKITVDEGPSDNQRRIIKLLGRMNLKNNDSKNRLYFDDLTVVAEKLIQENDLETLTAILPNAEFDMRKKLFSFALALPRLDVLKIILDSDNKKNYSYRKSKLEQLGVWPLLFLKSPCVIKKPMFNKQIIEPLIKAINHSFPIEDNLPCFNFLFPFSNELAHDKIINKLRLVTNLKKAGAVLVSDEMPISIALLVGESSFLSLLAQLKKLVQVVILADNEPRQLKHLQHMLACLDKAVTYIDYVTAYFTDNPILDELLYEQKKVDIGTLRNRVIRSDSTDKEHFLYSKANFEQCKHAAKTMTILFIKLDLTNIDRCQLLASIIANNNAKISFCNLTNVYDYDTHHKLKWSIPRLLRDEKSCLVMYSCWINCRLYSKLSLGLADYFSRCLNEAYQPLQSNDTTKSIKSSPPSLLAKVGLFTPSKRIENSVNDRYLVKLDR